MSGSGKKRKSQPNLKTAFQRKDKLFVHQGLTKLHEGKRLLRSAGTLCSPNPVPAGEENLLFQYSVKKINPDCVTAEIDYDECKIIRGGDAFQDDPRTSSESTIILIMICVFCLTTIRSSTMSYTFRRESLGPKNRMESINKLFYKD